MASGLVFLTAINTYYSDRDLRPALGLLVPVVLINLWYLADFLLVIAYQLRFYRLVRRNFERVPRRGVFSNMVCVPHLQGYKNKHLEISGHVAAALKRSEISYDQINDAVALRRVQVAVGEDLGTVRIMIYNYDFVANLDGYWKGFVLRISSMIFILLLL